MDVGNLIKSAPYLVLHARQVEIRQRELLARLVRLDELEDEVEVMQALLSQLQNRAVVVCVPALPRRLELDFLCGWQMLKNLRLNEHVLAALFGDLVDKGGIDHHVLVERHAL